MGEHADELINRLIEIAFDDYCYAPHRNKPKAPRRKAINPTQFPPPQLPMFKPKGKIDMALYKYTVEGKEVYGKRLAIDGMSWVMKSVDGSIAVIGARDAVEVLPYTVAVKFLADGGSAARTYHYIAKEGEVAVDDLLYIFDTSGLAVVTNIDTKSKAATKSLDAYVLSGKRTTKISVETE